MRENLYSEKSIIYYPKSSLISCICSTSKVKNLAEIPFVKLITESPKPQSISPSEEILISIDSVEFLEFNENNTPICIMDTGISPILDNFVIEKDSLHPSLNFEDNLNHGTSVASVAIFGEDLLYGQKKLSPKTKVIAFKIDDEEIARETNIEEAIIMAIKKYKKITPIFNLSYNYLEIPEELRKDMISRIDKLVQKENILLVNSAGNIFEDLAYNLKDRYPEYLTEQNVFCPSEGRYVFSVGSICKTSNSRNTIYSRHTRVGIPALIQNTELDKYDFFKPDIHTYGGDADPDDSLQINNLNEDKCFPTLDNKGNIVKNYGTSYSAPLVSLSLSRLHKKFKNLLKNSESYKAILMNHCKKGECNGITTFSLLNTDNVGNCVDGVYLNFEGESAPHEKSEEKDRSKVIKSKKIKFYMPKEAESVDAVISHSNNYSNSLIDKMNTKVILKLTKPTGVVCRKDYGNIGRKSAMTFAHYSFSRNYEGMWEAEVHIETSGIPSELFDKIKIRFGVSLKINLKKEENKNIGKLYQKILEKSPSAIREKEIEPLVVMEKIPQVVRVREKLYN